MARRLNLKSGMHERYAQFGSIAAMGKKTLKSLTFEMRCRLKITHFLRDIKSGFEWVFGWYCWTLHANDCKICWVVFNAGEETSFYDQTAFNTAAAEVKYRSFMTRQCWLYWYQYINALRGFNLLSVYIRKI